MNEYTLSVCWAKLAVPLIVQTVASDDVDDDTGPETDWWDAMRRALLPTDADRRLDRLIRGPVLLAVAIVCPILLAAGIGCVTVCGLLTAHLVRQ